MVKRIQRAGGGGYNGEEDSESRGRGYNGEEDSRLRSGIQKQVQEMFMYI